MGLTWRLLSHHHQRAGVAGGEITRPRGDKHFVNVMLLGDEIRGLIRDSGFSITAMGDTRMMHHISAPRPAA
jgi:hypothetical protein